jgi:hypothetical protein
MFILILKIMISQNTSNLLSVRKLATSYNLAILNRISIVAVHVPLNIPMLMWFEMAR